MELSLGAALFFAVLFLQCFFCSAFFAALFKSIILRIFIASPDRPFPYCTTSRERLVPG
jgi:hypothetical protein